MIRPIVHRFADADSVAKNAADDLIKKLKELLASKPEVHLQITGGTVGIKTLSELAQSQKLGEVDFKRVHFWWGDERFVPADSEDRNANQARRALLSKIEIDESKVHEFASSNEGLTLDAAAKDFSKLVERIKPHFDVILLGVGPDGHIASLFPGKPEPSAGEKIIAESDSPKPPPKRLSFSYEALNEADEVWFVVAGADKQEAVSVAFGDEPQRLPVGRVRGRKATHWYLDATAATTVFGC